MIGICNYVELLLLKYVESSSKNNAIKLSCHTVYQQCMDTESSSFLLQEAAPEFRRSFACDDFGGVLQELHGAAAVEQEDHDVDYLVSEC